MTDRLLLVALGVLGLLAIALAFVFRRDLARLAGTGPRRRRALFGAGLALLAPFGIGCAHKQAEAPQAVDSDEDEPAVVAEDASALMRDTAEIARLQQRSDQLTAEIIAGDALEVTDDERLEQIDSEIGALREQMRRECEQQEEDKLPRVGLGRGARKLEGAALETWKKIENTWQRADRIASDPERRRSFDHQQKDYLLDDLAGARTELQELTASGAISQGGGMLLAAELAVLYERAEGIVPSDERIDTRDRTGEFLCYLPGEIPTREEQSVGFLWQRLPLLEKLVAADTIRVEVLAKVLPPIERELMFLLGTQALRRPWSELSDEQICAALEWRQDRWPEPYVAWLTDEPGYVEKDHRSVRSMSDFAFTEEQRRLVDAVQKSLRTLRARLAAGDDR